MSSTISKILVPVDFSFTSKNAIKTAIAIAARQKASITLLHVMENEASMSSAKARVRIREYYVIERENIAYKIKKHDPEYKIKILQSTQETHSAIRLTAVEEKADLIVVGKYGMGGTLRQQVGKNVQALLQEFSVPILIVPPEGPWLDLNRITLPIRLINGLNEQYEYLRPILHKNKAELLIAGLSKSDAPGKVKELLALVGNIKVKLKEDNVTVTTKFTVSETIGWEIIATARQFYADLIVLTPQIDDDESKFYSGKYCTQVINDSKIPLLCIY